MLLFIYSMKDIIIDIAFTIGIIRPHSLEALMDIVYDPVYWKEMFRIIPIDYASFLQYHNE